MTAAQRLERDLPAILGDLAAAPYPDYIDEVLAATAQRRQRAAWTFPERWLPMELAPTRVQTPRFPGRTLGVLALIGLLIAGALAAYVGTRPRLPAPFGPAANGQVAVASDGDIHMVDPQTGSSTAIVRGPEVDTAAAVSPDGTRVAFLRQIVRDNHTLFDLVTVRADGSDPIVLTTEPLMGGFDLVAWAPDGRSLLADHRGDEDLWRYDASAPAPPTLVASDAQAYPAPFRPPDGSALLIYRQTDSKPNLISLDLRTTQETILATARAIEDLGDARWAPDGSAVVYSSSTAEDYQSQRLFIVSADGRTTRQITDAPGIWWDIDATWAPGGDRIAFDRYERVGSDWLVRSLAIYDVASDAVREVGPLAREVRLARPTDDDLSASTGEGYWFEWSPDGRSLVAVPTEAAAYPIIIDAATGEWRLLDVLVTPEFVTEAWQRVAPPD